MPATIDSRTGLGWGYSDSEGGWGAQMNTNFRELSRWFSNRPAVDRLNSPPGSPTTESIYIVGTAPAGDWSARTAGDLAMWTGSAWVYKTPQKGFLIYLETDSIGALDDTLLIFKTSWVAV